MTSHMDLSSEFSTLMSNLVEGGLTPSQFDRLAEILEADPAARAVYRDHLSVHAMLYWRWHQQTSANQTQSPRPETTATSPVEEAARQSIAEPSPSIPLLDVPSAAPSTYSLFSNVAHGTIGFFSQELPFALLIATVITGLGLLAGSFIYVTHHQQLAANHSASKPTPTPLQTKLDYVGRITGMVDCRLQKGTTLKVQGSRTHDFQTFIPNPQSLVSLGDKFSLSSGLLEITYDSGARVILQGPCNYEIASPVGGFLSLGRLTASVEKKPSNQQSAISSQRSEKVVSSQWSEKVASGQWPVVSKEGSGFRIQNTGVANHKSEIINHKSQSPAPVFTIHTPTATVTDLGTEFGVEVDKHGNTASYVFRGKIAVEPIVTDGQPHLPVELHENQSIRVNTPEEGHPVTSRAAVDPSHFIRTSQFAKLSEKQNQTPIERWQVYSRQLRRDPSLLAYYTFEKHNQSTSILPNQSPLGSVLDGKVENAEWVEGRISGKLALYFHGPGSGDKVTLPQQERFNFSGPFSVAVWFKVKEFAGVWQNLISKGDTAWRLQYFDQFKKIVFDTNGISKESAPSLQPLQPLHETMPRSAVNDGRYHLFIAVCQPTGSTVNKLLYVDGRLEGNDKQTPPIHKNSDPVCLGSMSIFPDREFSGWIDEVAILSRALTADEVKAAFEAGNPNNGVNDKKR